MRKCWWISATKFAEREREREGGGVGLYFQQVVGVAVTLNVFL
jgi:hypothetical protein